MRTPDPDSLVGKIYLALKREPGATVNIYEAAPGSFSNAYSNAIRYLVTQYSCDIVMVKPKHYRLIAEYVGKDWVVYDKSTRDLTSL